MSESKINLSINGQCQVPPGFRFHPTEEELLNYYLRKKVAFEKIDLDVIREVDLNKLEPWDIQETCRIGSTPQNDWYFFSHKDKKYPTGTRTNRATAAGFWKATGRDKIIYSGCKRIGLRKTLVFYKGRAPHGQKSDWIMHEYRLDDSNNNNLETNASNGLGESVTEDGWVVCRVFKKKNYLMKTLDSPKGSSTSMDVPKSNSLLNGSSNDGVLDQILLYMGRSCKTENENAFRNRINITNEEEEDDDDNNNNKKFTIPLSNSFGFGSFEALQEKFMHLPRLESPSLQPPLFSSNTSSQFDGSNSKLYNYQTLDEMFSEPDHQPSSAAKPGGWAALDRLVASQLNGQLETADDQKQLACFADQINGEFGGGGGGNDGDDNTRLSQLHSSRSDQSLHVYNGENDIWSFTNSSSPSSSDPLCHLSV